MDSPFRYLQHYPLLEALIRIIIHWFSRKINLSVPVDGSRLLLSDQFVSLGGFSFFQVKTDVSFFVCLDCLVFLLYQMAGLCLLIIAVDKEDGVRLYVLRVYLYLILQAN